MKKQSNPTDMAKEKKSNSEELLDKTIKRRNFISFATFFVGAGAAFEGWKWLYHSPEEAAGITAGAHRPLRKALNKTEVAFRNFFSNRHLVKTYPVERAAKKPRTNSYVGIDDKGFDPAKWQLKIVKSNNDIQTITIDQIKALPKTKLVYDFKCVEGWDEIQYWAGVKFIDFLEHFGLAEKTKLDYIGMETPNGQYYVGIDMASALHPQTLLAYEMNDKPISIEQGAPLRLIIPVKYGIKNLKRIGTISFSNTRPKDYWAEQGYDYYSGL